MRESNRGYPMYRRIGPRVQPNQQQVYPQQPPQANLQCQCPQQGAGYPMGGPSAPRVNTALPATQLQPMATPSGQNRVLPQTYAQQCPEGIRMASSAMPPPQDPLRWPQANRKRSQPRRRTEVPKEPCSSASSASTTSSEPEKHVKRSKIGAKSYADVLKENEDIVRRCTDQVAAQSEEVAKNLTAVVAPWGRALYIRLKGLDGNVVYDTVEDNGLIYLRVGPRLTGPTDPQTPKIPLANGVFNPEALYHPVLKEWWTVEDIAKRCDIPARDTPESEITVTLPFRVGDRYIKSQVMWFLRSSQKMRATDKIKDGHRPIMDREALVESQQREIEMLKEQLARVNQKRAEDAQRPSSSRRSRSLQRPHDTMQLEDIQSLKIDDTVDVPLND